MNEVANGTEIPETACGEGDCSLNFLDELKSKRDKID